MQKTSFKSVFVADVGGTSARFGLFRGDAAGAEPVLAQRMPVAAACSFSELLGKAAGMGFPAGPDEVDAAVFAVPGPVRGEKAVLPNIPWDADLHDAGPWSGRCRLINDFEAQARACMTPLMQRAELLHTGDPDPAGTLAVIGAGTGLGHAAILQYPEGWLPMLSEAGHAVFPLLDEEELWFSEFVRRRGGRCPSVGDDMVSGNGLALLHEFLTGETVTPEQAGERLDPDGPVAETFSKFYGRACRNWVLSSNATGGLVICGGVASHSPELVRSVAFQESFFGRDDYTQYMRAIRVRLNADPLAGLHGAAQAAFHLLQSGD
jgi:glucokinase